MGLCQCSRLISEPCAHLPKWHSNGTLIITGTVYDQSNNVRCFSTHLTGLLLNTDFRFFWWSCKKQCSFPMDKAPPEPQPLGPHTQCPETSIDTLYKRKYILIIHQFFLFVNYIIILLNIIILLVIALLFCNIFIRPPSLTVTLCFLYRVCWLWAVFGYHWSEVAGVLYINIENTE